MSQNFQLSTRSLENLQNVHPELRRLVEAVAQEFEVEVLCGYRGEAEQMAAYHSGHSKLPFPESKHNRSPAEAVDLSPVPYDPSNKDRLYFIAGFVLGTASRLGVRIRCGADFNQNFDPKDEHFKDLFHFELI
jgi:peptidoglycan L-alanyl-D-glutamate endopeptidase CwlK